MTDRLRIRYTPPSVSHRIFLPNLAYPPRWRLSQ